MKEREELIKTIERLTVKNISKIKGYIACLDDVRAILQTKGILSRTPLLAKRGED
jgi:hypothetical protein